MAPPSLWSGNLRLSLVLIPVRLVPAVSTEEAISFRQIHEPSGTPIRYMKGVHDGDSFTEAAEEEIVKGYEHAKGQHILIDPKEIDDLKLEAKHIIDMVRFVDEEEIDTRYWEKPYYLVPDGDEADEGYAIMQRALAETGKVAIPQSPSFGNPTTAPHILAMSNMPSTSFFAIGRCQTGYFRLGFDVLGSYLKESLSLAR